MPLFSSTLVSILLVWLITSSLYVYPHSLSYFNESIGGPLNGHRHLNHSNIDWGQDLRYFKWWRSTQQASQPIFLAYFGDLDPRDLDIKFELPSVSEWDSHIVNGASNRWYAISTTCLGGYPWPVPDGNGGERSLPSDMLAHLRNMTPKTRFGYSIFLFQL